MNEHIPALIIILTVLLGCVWIGLIWSNKRPAPAPMPELDPVLENPPNTALAHRVWAAHTANQELDLAILTGTAQQVKDAETKALAANSHLIAYLSERAAS